MNKVYFPNLNGLRFIAALLVVIHHIEQIKHYFKLDNNWENPFISIIGKLGVILFFVLSGFLITYLLLEEEKQTGTIAVKNFYIRRILRIWPLYFLIISLGLFILPQLPFFSFPGIDPQSIQTDILPKSLLFFFFLANLTIIIFGPVPFAAQSWSIGTEEQFYLIWPALMKSSKNKYYLMFGVIIFYLIIKFSLIAIAPVSGTLAIFQKFWQYFPIDCMAIGGIGALLLFHKKESILKIIYNSYVQIAMILLLTGLLYKGIRIPYLHFEFYSLLFIVLILNLSANAKSIFKIENNVFSYLGKISYGLYMYHPIAIFISIKFLMAFGLATGFLIFTCSLLMTIIFASLSYHFIESYFLKIKSRFSAILSGQK